MAAMTFWRRYLGSVGDALSQLLNAVVFVSLDANQSLSGRCHEQNHQAIYRTLERLIDGLFFLVFRQRNHCRKAYQSDVDRALARLSEADLSEEQRRHIVRLYGLMLP